MEVYKNETREVIKRFRDHRLNYRECICSLDAAVAALIPRIQCEELPVLRELMALNREMVMAECRRRTRPPLTVVTSSFICRMLKCFSFAYVSCRKGNVDGAARHRPID